MVSGGLMPSMWGAVGLSIAMTGIGAGWRWPVLLAGVICVVVALGLSRLDLTRVPPALVRAMPYGGLPFVMFVSHSVPRGGAMLVAAAVAMMWTGFALELIDVAAVGLLSIGAVLAAQWTQFPPLAALWHTAEVSVLVLTCGLAMYWVRWRMDAAMDSAAQAQAQVAGQEAQRLLDSQQAEAQRAESAAAQLAERTRLQRQVADQASALAAASDEVSTNTSSAAAAAEEMSMSLQELTRTAQVTEEITSAVVRKADHAASVIGALESSSARIMAASDVIQAIAGQTNLLALNATIESARAGEAGRGFAVVANEVKDLARQSGENADTITNTLTEVQAQVAAAVAGVAEITASMAELSSHHGTLAAAIEEQSAAVSQVSQSVTQTAGEVSSMAEGIRSLEQISHIAE
jgi:Methyl-accepting chemotaxis protein (MCP) signalling domain